MMTREDATYKEKDFGLQKSFFVNFRIIVIITLCWLYYM